MLPMSRYFGDVQKAAHVIMLSGGLGALVVARHGLFRRGFKQLKSPSILWFLGHIVPYFFQSFYQILAPFLSTERLKVFYFHSSFFFLQTYVVRVWCG